MCMCVCVSFYLSNLVTEVFQQPFAVVTVDTSSPHSRLSTHITGPKLMTSFAKKKKKNWQSSLHILHTLNRCAQALPSSASTTGANLHGPAEWLPLHTSTGERAPPANDNSSQSLLNGCKVHRSEIQSDFLTMSKYTHPGRREKLSS